MYLEFIFSFPIVYRDFLCQFHIDKRVYPDLTDDEYNTIISIKQTYFLDHLDETEVNFILLDLMKRVGRGNCFLWTSADRIRIEHLIDFHGLSKYYNTIFYSNKINITKDIAELCRITNEKLNNLVFMMTMKKYQSQFVRIKKSLVNRVNVF